MKKFLLIAIAALFVGTANAQLVKKQAVSKPQAKHHVLPQATFKKYEAVQAKPVGKPLADKSVKRFQTSLSLKNSLNPVVRNIQGSRRAAVQPEYEGTGTDRDDGAVEWSMFTGTSSDGNTLLLQDVIPNPFGFENGVVVEYTVESGNIVIQPQLVASTENSASPTGMLYIYLESATTADGSITLTMDESNNITGSYSILYGAYSTDTYNQDDYLGYWTYVSGVKYNLPGEIVTPSVSFEPNSLVLFASLGLNGYSYNNNLAFTSAYAPFAFRNLTSDKVTEWQWSVSSPVDEETTEVVATGNEPEFEFNTVGGEAYTDIQLVGLNQTVSSDPFIFGVGKSLDDGGELNYTTSYVYAGGYEGEFLLNNETPAIITRQDPDGDLTFYTNWGTPDKASNSMSKIYIYHEKPAAPLYIEGVTLPLVSATFNTDFNLHIKIYEASYPTTSSRPTLGRILAEGDATSANLNTDFNAGLTGVEFTELYVEDESGLSETLDYLFLDTEFVIVIEGWDNGTFSGVLGSQDAPLDNARTSTWFEMSGNEGSMYSYTSWKTSLFVGLLGATSGYLYTEDNTNVVIPDAGGQVAINVHPMFSNQETDANGSKTRIWLDDSSDEIPDWLSVGFANEDYENNYTFDLVFEAEALPASVEGRQATLVFVQEGAKLEVVVSQGATGINTSIKNVETVNGPIYNLQGQRVDSNYKGIVIMNGKKVVVK